MKNKNFLSECKWLLYRHLPNRILLESLNITGKEVWLTFDDGPDPEITPRLLDLLDRLQVKGTFYVVGIYVEKYPEIVADIVRRGHALGNHTWGHWGFHDQPLQQQINQVLQTDTVLSEYDGNTRHGFRPPNGLLTPGLLYRLAKRRINTVLWSRNSMDYIARDAQEIIEQFIRRPIQAGDIILFHDDKQHTIDALEVLLRLWLDAGFAFLPLPSSNAFFEDA